MRYKFISGCQTLCNGAYGFIFSSRMSRTSEQFEVTFKRLGIEIKFEDFDNPAAFEAKIDDCTCGIHFRFFLKKTVFTF